MTKLLYLPESKYISFSTNTRFRTFIYEEADCFGRKTIQERIKQICDNKLTNRFYQLNGLDVKYLTREMFEIIYD